MIQRKRKLAISSFMFFLLVAVLAGSKLPGWTYAPKIEFLILLGITCCLPALIALSRRSFDLFEPVHALVLTTFVYFCLVPFILLYDPEGFVMRGVNYVDVLPKVTFFAWLSLLGFFLGYYWPHRKVGYRIENQLSPTTLRYVHRWSTIVLVFFSSLIVLWVVVGGIPLRTLWIFNEASYGSWWSAAEGPKIGYLYAARESIPACILLLIMSSPGSRRWSVSSILLLLITGIIFAGTGGRSRVLLVWLSALILYYLDRDKRPTTSQAGLIGFTVFYVIIGILGFYRGAGRVVGEDIPGFQDVWDVFLESIQIVVGSALFVHWVPMVTGYLWGYSYLKVLIQPIPRFLWPGKPFFLGFGVILGPYTATGTAKPVWIDFYNNFGPIGIVVGMVLGGYLCRRVYNAYCYDRQNIFAQITLALFLPFMLKSYGRGDPALIFYTAIYVLAPVWIVRTMVRRKLQAHPHRSTILWWQLRRRV